MTPVVPVIALEKQRARTCSYRAISITKEAAWREVKEERTSQVE